MNKSVLIMMATYNGSKYIKEQIDSILNQTFSNWNLLIRDDGSDDDTCSIVERYLTDKRIQLIKNLTDTHGPNSNFKELVLAGGHTTIICFVTKMILGTRIRLTEWYMRQKGSIAVNHSLYMPIAE